MSRLFWIRRLFESKATPAAKRRPVKLRLLPLEDRLTPAAPFAEFVDPNPNPGNQFGASVVALSTGNVVITSPFDDAGGTDAGAVYLFNGATGALISTLRGSTVSDNIGSSGVTALSNGNYVVRSQLWDNGAVPNAGAVTFGSGTTGVAGAVSPANSLVGSTASDIVGINGVTALSNGNYVVISASWNNGAVLDAGAVTFGSGTTGVVGAVSAANSLVGSTASDQVGSSGVTPLSNGNYVVGSRLWNNGAVVDAGAATFGSGTTGVVGAISAANSLVGSTASDQVGEIFVTALSNGNYVVVSRLWNNGAVSDAGAVTFGSGTTGVVGAVSAANSLVGSTVSDQLGNGGVTALSNGNYVVSSPKWDNGAVFDAGAVTLGSGTTGVVGDVSAANSLVGFATNDQVGNGDAMALTNGNYVVGSSAWDNGAVANAGAATFGSGTTGAVGPITTLNSALGLAANTTLVAIILDDVNGTFFGRFLTEGGGRIRVGSQVDGFAPNSTVPNINLSVSANAGTEAAGTVITVTATTSAPVTGNATVNLTVSGAGITVGDFTLSNTTITILNGQTTGSVTFTVLNDSEVEPVETATLTIVNPSANIALGTTSRTIAITSDDTSFVVTNLNDNGLGSFRQAVMNAEAAAGADIVTFQAGLAGRITLTSGQVLVTQSLDIQGNGAVTISGNNASRIILADLDAGELLRVAGLTLTGGSAEDGGAINMINTAGSFGDLTIVDSNLTDNTANSDGGAVSAEGGNIVFRNTTFANNRNPVGSGGAFYIDVVFNSSVPNLSSVIIDNSTFTNNVADDVGGALFLADVGMVAISGSTFTGNSSESGGAITFEDTAATIANSTFTGNTTVSGIYNNRGGAIHIEAGSVTISNSSFAGNAADEDGGAISFIGTSGTHSIRNTTFSDNTTNEDGGALFLETTFFGVNVSNLSLAVENSTFSGNTGDNGGAIHVNSVNANITNSTFSGNTARDNGGAVHMTNGTSATIDNSTIVLNRAGTSGAGNAGGIGVIAFTGGGVSALELRSTIVAGNTHNNGVANELFRNGSSVINVSNSLIQTDPTALLNGTNTGNLFGVDPLLAPLANNGGPTQTHLPAAGSSAIDAGANPTGLTTDQRGFARLAGAGVDIGAVERDAVPVSPPPPLPPVVPPPPSVHVFLRAVDAGSGGGPLVVAYNADGSERFRFLAYDSGFIGGVRVATADVTGDGVDDIITGAGAGAGSHVKVFDGMTGAEIRSFFAYDPSFAGGGWVGGGDVNDDGFADIITGAGAGGGPHVKVFDGRTGVELASFYAYQIGFTGGVTVAAGDFNGDGRADVVTGAGEGSGPHVAVFDATALGQTNADGTLSDNAVLASFMAFDIAFMGGVNVSAGDFNGDGRADVVVGAGPGSGPHVKVIDTARAGERDGDRIADAALLASFLGFEEGFRGGVRVGVANTLPGGGRGIILGAGPRVRVLRADGQIVVEELFAFAPELTGDVYVG